MKKKQKLSPMDILGRLRQRGDDAKKKAFVRKLKEGERRRGTDSPGAS